MSFLKLLLRLLRLKNTCFSILLAHDLNARAANENTHFDVLTSEIILAGDCIKSDGIVSKLGLC